MEMSTDKLVTRQEAAELLQLKPQTLAAWGMQAQHLPFVRVGKAIRYRLSDVEAFIERHTVPVTEKQPESQG
jgi:excisionase family DNA binding protein